ncbi:hypothetical protein [Frankia tisae]|uniref:hypothetical protein n=1 Tax=Frankia tisae TaxID=2950104 RepID=UPI0021BE9FAA|nr:hypothetical protein [Frankia tisae]
MNKITDLCVEGNEPNLTARPGVTAGELAAALSSLRPDTPLTTVHADATGLDLIFTAPEALAALRRSVIEGSTGTPDPWFDAATRAGLDRSVRAQPAAATR